MNLERSDQLDGGDRFLRIRFGPFHGLRRCSWLAPFACRDSRDSPTNPGLGILQKPIENLCAAFLANPLSLPRNITLSSWTLPRQVFLFQGTGSVSRRSARITMCANILWMEPHRRIVATGSVGNESPRVADWAVCARTMLIARTGVEPS